MATKHQQPRSLYGTAKAHGNAQAQEARLALAEAGGREEARHGAEEAESHVGPFVQTSDGAFVQTDAALKRLITEPGETWVLQTDQPEEIAMAALGTWSQARGVFVIVFGPGEHFSLLTTQPGDTVIIHTAHPENLNQEALAGWAKSRGLALAVLPPDITVAQLDDATLDQMHLMRKPQGLIIPSAGQMLGNGRPQ